MKIEIKQNPYNAAWYVRPMCPESSMILRQDASDNRMSNERIAKITGRDWFQNYMHGALGNGPFLIDVPSL